MASASASRPDDVDVALSEGVEARWVVLGAPGAGKSTVVGCVMAELADARASAAAAAGAPQPPPSQFDATAIRVLEKTATNPYAAALFKHESERRSLSTADIAVVHGVLPSERALALVDVPGRKLAHAFHGAAVSSGAVVVVDAREAAVTGALQRDGALSQQLLMLHALRLAPVVLAVSFMDAVDYDESRFNSARTEASELIRKHLGFVPVAAVPVAALSRQGVLSPSSKMTWHAGPTLVGAIASHSAALVGREEDVRLVQKPLRALVQGAIKVSGVGTVALVHVAAGTLYPDTDVHLSVPSELTAAHVKRIERDCKGLPAAPPGSLVGVSLRNIPFELVRRGTVMSDMSAKHVPRLAAVVHAQIVVTNWLGSPKKKKGINPGFEPVICCHTLAAPVRLTEIVAVLDKSGAQVSGGPPLAGLKPGNRAIVKLRLLSRAVVEAPSPDRPESLSKFVLIGGQRVVAVGEVQSVEHYEHS